VATGQLISPASWERIKDPNRLSGIPSRDSEQTAKESRQQDIFMEDARERFRMSANAQDRQRAEMRDDYRFHAGIQWDESIKAVRDQQGRPCLTINRIPGFVSHVTNNMRQQRPEIKIDPIAEGADEEIAQVREGLIRHIEISSQADIAGDKAFENLCIMGLGYVRVVDGWADDRSVTDQELRVDWVPNIFSVFEDPAATKPDWSDGKYKFIVEDITLLEFRRRFGKDRSPASLSEFTSIGADQPYWLLGDKIRIAEYFHIEEEDDILYETNDGIGIYDSELGDPTDDPAWKDLKVGENGQYVWRDAKRNHVMWTLLYGLGVLRQREWKGKYIPVIPFIGSQVDLEGERILVGMVRYARESQRMFNYMYSCFVEACALAPRAPWVAEAGSIEDFQDQYKNANTDPQAVLMYRQRSVDGTPVAPPRRETAEPPIQAFVAGLKLADDNLKSVFRIFDASLGQKGPQESGIAINSRKIESDLATYDWIDNYTRGLRFLGIVLDDLLQYYYNRPGRIIRILQEDLQRKPITMNQAGDGQDAVYDLSKGKFAITVSTGPGFATRRQEAAKSMVDMAKVYPPLMQSCGPLIIRSMDWPEKDAIAAQLEKTLPPELRAPNPDAPKDDPEQLKQGIAQLTQQNQVMAQMLTKLSDKHESDYQKEIFDTFRTQMTGEFNLAIAMLKTKSQEAAALNAEIFEEMKRVRAVAEGLIQAGGQTQQPGQPPTSLGAPESAAAPPSASAPQVPPQGANTPVGVGTGQ
jgi:hypothetical protein